MEIPSKHEEEEPGVGEPQGSAATLELSFFARAPSAGEWRKLTESVGLQVLPLALTQGRSDLWSTEFIVLPESIKQDSLFLRGEVHPLLDEPEVTHWNLRLRRVPDPTPPQSLIEASQRIGNYPGIIGRIVSAWPAEPRLEMTFKVSFVLDEKHWRSPFTPPKRMALKPIAAAGHKATLSFESYTWKVEPSGVLSEVSDLGYVDRAKGLFGLSCSGQGMMEVGVDMFSQAEALLWHSIARFLKKPLRRGRTRTKP